MAPAAPTHRRGPRVAYRQSTLVAPGLDGRRQALPTKAPTPGRRGTPSLLIRLEEEAHGSEGPLVRRVVAAHRRREDERRPADGGRVDGALVDALGNEVLLRDAHDVHHRQRRVEL